MCRKNGLDANQKNLDVLCFGDNDWWYHNHGHMDIQLMQRFAKIGTVLYINSIVIQKPKFGRSGNFSGKFLRKARSILKGLSKSGEGFWVYSPFTLPVHHISWARPLQELLLRIQIKNAMRKLNIQDPIIWVACPGACYTSIRLSKRKLIWQRADRWEEFPDVDADIIATYDRKLKAEADLTVFVNSVLYQEEREQCKNAFYLDHGVDYEMFAQAHEDSWIPPDIAAIPRPIVGFFGGIDDHTFDLAFMEKVVDLLPQMSFVFVGKVSFDISGLRKKNVWLLGQKPYEQIPHYGKCFDVAIMPWRQNRWIEACNPIKLKEYLALGKPIISTPFSELSKYSDLVKIASDAQCFAQAVREALKENNSKRVATRRRRVAGCTWDSKAREVLHALRKEPTFGEINGGSRVRMESIVTDSYLPELESKSQQIIRSLCATAKKGLADCYCETGWLKNSHHFNSKLAALSMALNLRYVIIAQIGIRRWLRFHSDNETLPDFWEYIHLKSSQINSAGDLGLVIWAAVESGVDEYKSFVGKLVNNWAGLRQTCSAIELAWVIQGLVMLRRRQPVINKTACVLEDAYGRLMSLYCDDAGLFARHSRTGLGEAVSRGIACFADQVYPILALANYGRDLQDDKSIDVAVRVARTMCQLQGPKGQWWWHYDVKRARVAEEYPVFSVHQGAMAPMALLAIDKTAGTNHSSHIERGLMWIEACNELQMRMIVPQRGVIWRDIHRREIGKMYRLARGALSAGGWDTAHRLAGRNLFGYVVNKQCRPYHLGWVLYAWAGHLSALNASPQNDCS